MHYPVGLPVGRRGTTVVIYDGAVKKSKSGSAVYEKTAENEVRRIDVSLNEFRAALQSIMQDDGNAEAVLGAVLDVVLRPFQTETGHHIEDVLEAVDRLRDGAITLSSSSAAARDYQRACTALRTIGIDPQSLAVGVIDGVHAVFSDLAPRGNRKHPMFDRVVNALRSGRKNGARFRELYDTTDESVELDF